MNMEEGTREFDHGARRLQGAMLEHPNLAIDRMPGLSFALNRFIVEAPARLVSLIARPSGAAIEEIRATTLFEAIGECSGLTAAIYSSAEPEAQFMIALNERIDSLIVSSEGDLVIMTTGSALQDGSIGDIVRVRNDDSGATVSGAVQPDGSVRVRGGS